MKKITHEGTLELTSKLSLPCYVLDDGTRVISGRGMQDVLRLVDEGSVGQKPGSRLTRLLNNKSLKPFIFKAKEADHFKPIECTKGHAKINGYEATVLVDICDAMLEARKQKVKMTARQKIITDQCEILIRSFARIGIIALVDEATGYQYDREKKELQTILKFYISEEILEWQKTFHDNFYKEIFRLWEIPFTPQGIKKKPQFVGRLTNKLIYEKLPRGVLVKLKENTPRTEGGNWKYKLHQSLTPEVGREHLKKQLYEVTALASVSKNKREFLQFMEKKYGQLELPFTDIEELEPSLKEENKMSFGNAISKIAKAGKPH